ncbi:MAG: acetoacetate decarboxylase family protein [Actinobacteria bacterium]|nr:acetoacetate decarboxylase family protein [Actinomycetota bacterium]
MFLRSEAEAGRLLELIGRPYFNDARMLQAECEADPERLRRAIPEEFELEDPARVMVEVGHWGESPVGPFGGGGLYVPCSFGASSGLYVLSMYMDTAAAIAFGRETFGEPKRQADVVLEEAGEEIRGSLSRAGVRIIAITMAREVAETRPGGESRNFNVSFRWAPDGTGIEGDVTVNQATFELGEHRREAGAASVTLTDGPHDRISELGIGAPIAASFVHGDVASRNEHVGTVDGERFLPHAFARYDDWLYLSGASAEVGA